MESLKSLSSHAGKIYEWRFVWYEQLSRISRYWEIWHDNLLDLINYLDLMWLRSLVEPLMFPFFFNCINTLLLATCDSPSDSLI